MSDLIYDSSALNAGEANRISMWRIHRQALDRHSDVGVPASVLAQVIRDGPQVNLYRMLRGVEIMALIETDARAIGKILAAAGTSDIVDAHVVHLALTNAAPVVSGDRPDLEHLARAIGRRITVIEP